MSNNPVRLQSGNGVAITQTSNALDINIKSGTTLSTMQADIATIKADIAIIKGLLQ